VNYKDLMADLKKGRIEPVYLIYGPEHLLATMMKDHIKKTLVEPAYEQFNYTYVDGRDLEVSEIVNYCETLPFMEEKKLVVIAGYSELSGKGASDPQIAQLTDYIQSPNPTTCLVFLSDTVDKKKKLTKQLIKHGQVVVCDKLDPRDLAKWIQKRVKLAGKTMAPRALEIFIESIGYLGKDSKMDLYDVENEVEKLIAFCGVQVNIDESMVERITAKNVENNIFEMLDHLGRGSVDAGLTILNRLLTDGESPPKILQMMVRQLRILYQCKWLRAQGHSAGSIAKEAGLRSFQVNKALNQGKRFDYERLACGYQACREAEVKMKSSRTDQKILLEMLLIRL